MIVDDRASDLDVVVALLNTYDAYDSTPERLVGVASLKRLFEKLGWTDVATSRLTQRDVAAVKVLREQVREIFAELGEGDAARGALACNELLARVRPVLALHPAAQRTRPRGRRRWLGRGATARGARLGRGGHRAGEPRHPAGAVRRAPVPVRLRRPQPRRVAAVLLRAVRGPLRRSGLPRAARRPPARPYERRGRAPSYRFMSFRSWSHLPADRLRTSPQWKPDNRRTVRAEHRIRS